MPRGRPSKPKASTPATLKSHKRQLSSPINVTPGSRVSKRLKETPTSAKKSKYFEPDSNEDEEDEPEAESAFEDEEDESVAEPSSADPTSDEEDEEDEENYESEAENKPKRKRGRQTKSAGENLITKVVETGKELWRQGVKAGLGPGKQVFIEKPKPREDGGVKYVPERVHPNTMEFLADLKKNNDREWLKMHDPDYRTSWKDFESFVESLTERLMEKDETIPELPPKDLVFRIYRDVRFSSDPTPYKTHFSAAWSRTGRKGPYSHYYMQIAPGGKSFVGAGLWMPEAEPLRLLRRNVDRKPEKIREVLTEANLRKKILGGVSNDEKKTIKAFASQNTENALKTKPKGYEADHPNIELLRLRNYTIGRKLKDEEVLSSKAIDTIADLMGTMTPFVHFLNSVVMPDDDDDDGDDGNEDEESPSNDNANGVDLEAESQS